MDEGQSPDPSFLPLDEPPRVDAPTARLIRPEPPQPEVGGGSEPSPPDEGVSSAPAPAPPLSAAADRAAEESESSPDGPPVVIARGLGHANLFNVEFQVGSGVTALVGPQGAGKTQLLRLLLGIESPSSGTLTVAGCALPSEGLAVRACVGYVPEAPAFYPEMTGVELSQFLGGIYGTWNTKTFYDLLARLGVPARRRIESLLPAVRARMALAAALAIRPKLLLVDTPRDLDAIGRRELLLGVREERGEIPAIVTSARPEDVEGLADSLLVLARGAILYQGAPSGLRAEGQSLEAAYVERVRG